MKSAKDHPAALIFGVVALFGAVLCAYAVGSIQRSGSARDQIAISKHYENERNNALRGCSKSDGSASVLCAVEVTEAAQEKSIAQQDLLAQQEMANWAFWMTLFTGVSAVVAIAGVWFVKETLSATLEALAEARQSTKSMFSQNLLTELGSRAWLDIRIEDSPRLIFDHMGNYRISFLLTITNHGNIPAIAVSSGAELQRSNSEGNIDFSDYTKRSNGIKKFTTMAVMPGQTKIDRVESQLLDLSGLDKNGLLVDGSIPLILMGVTYVYPGAKQICYTVLSTSPKRALAADGSGEFEMSRNVVWKTHMA